MKGYIYHIINKTTNKYYVGKTINYEHRMEDHLSRLRLGKHHSIELQRAYNKYGENDFIFEKYEVDVKDDHELSKLEIKEIEKYDSYYNGYNETLGGEGNKTVFNYNQSILIYNICKRYKGIYRCIARYFNCDDSVIRGIANNSTYENENYDMNELNNLIQELKLSDDNLNENYKPHNERKLNQEQCFEILSVITTESGYDKILCNIFNITCVVTNRLKKNEIYLDYIDLFNNLSNEEKEEIKNNVFNKYNLKSLRGENLRKRNKNVLTQEQVDYILDNKDKKSKVQIGLDLGISADRVGGVCNNKYYKDLIENYYKRH